MSEPGTPFALRIDFLTGHYCAQAHDDRDWPEWPPHPARVFSALVAAWAEAGKDVGERQALEWLESQPPPSIHATSASVRGIDPARREGRQDRHTSITTYVPVNDVFLVPPSGVAKQYDRLLDIRAKLEVAEGSATVGKAQESLASQVKKVRDWSSQAQSPSKSPPTASVVGDKMQIFPESRTKQPRTFPVAIPDDPVVHFIWNGVPDYGQAEFLDKLAGRVPRLGHSSSLVSISVVTDPPVPTLVPAAEGIHVRVPGRGQLEALQRAYAVHGGVQPRQLPFRSQMYEPLQASAELPVSILSGEWLVLEAEPGARLRPTDSMILTQAIRAALMSNAHEPMPVVLSGHEPDGAPTSRPHLAILPLPFVGRAHADGTIRGFALSLPRNASTSDRAAVAGALQVWGRVRGGGLLLTLPGGREINLRLLVADPVPWTLERYRWSRPSRVWPTVTPLAFDRAPGRLWTADRGTRVSASRAATEVVSVACERVGLPRPEAVEVTQTARLVGVPRLREFPVYQSPGRGARRVSAHVSVEFAEPVRGPLVLGAGRFFGMGLFAPVREGVGDESAWH